MCGCTSAARRSTTWRIIGNARTMVVFDVLARLLRRLYPRVTYVRNITDVDDKINARAKESGEPIAAITARTTADFHADMAALGVLPPDEEPRATQHIAQMIEIIERLIAAGHAYAAEGHVLFSVPSFRRMDSCRAAARTSCWPARGSTWRRTSAIPAISCCGSRRRPTCRAGTARGAAAGRAGTSSAARCRGAIWARRSTSTAAARDLIFPHHENELAQSLCAFPGSRFARYWVHSGMLQRERREDVEEPRQLLHHPRGAGARRRPRRCGLR